VTHSLDACVQPFSSVVLICSKIEEQLTYWIQVQLLSLMIKH
jgi:hypothetical protein